MAKKEVKKEETKGDEEVKKAKKKKLEIVDPKKAAEDEGGYKPKMKPKLSKDKQRALNIKNKMNNKRPDFKRQEWFRYGRLDKKWQKPRGMHSKMRRHHGYRINVASIGYSSPRGARGLHPSGFEEVLVYRPDDLEKLDPERQAARIGHTVGTKKRADILDKADELGIRVLNPNMPEEKGGE